MEMGWQLQNVYDKLHRLNQRSYQEKILKKYKRDVHGRFEEKKIIKMTDIYSYQNIYSHGISCTKMKEEKPSLHPYQKFKRI